MIPENFVQFYLLLVSVTLLPLSFGILFDLENGIFKFLKPLIFYGKTLEEKNILSYFSVPKRFVFLNFNKKNKIF